MMENVQSGDADATEVDDNPAGVTPCTSDVCTHRTSRMLAIGTAIHFKSRQLFSIIYKLLFKEQNLHMLNVSGKIK